MNWNDNFSLTLIQNPTLELLIKTPCRIVMILLPIITLPGVKDETIYRNVIIPGSEAADAARRHKLVVTYQ